MDSDMAANASSDAVAESLSKRGWSVADTEHVKALITLKSILLDGPRDAFSIADAVESDLLNSDLRSIGAKSLPDSASFRKSSHLFGPKVLQISSARDICKSSIEEASNNSSRRMLRLTLTDGHTEITAVEFTRTPSLPNDVVPGTKVRLENKVAVRSGLVCLDPRALTFLGGMVQSLHEEWQMNKKYSAISRESLQPLQSDIGGPPPFEKLRINASSSRAAQSEKPRTASKSNQWDSGKSTDTLKDQSFQRLKNCGPSGYDEDMSLKESSSAGKHEEKPSTSDTRQIGVAESAPVQNQAAAQKLLQKMAQPSQERQRGRRGRGRGRQDEAEVLTLEEWEKRKAAVNTSMNEKLPDISNDEDLAWQLQNKFDMEDAHHGSVLHMQGSSQETEAERIRRSMFSYEKENDSNAHGSGRGRGGRGRGRGRGRRGRGRFS